MIKHGMGLFLENHTFGPPVSCNKELSKFAVAESLKSSKRSHLDNGPTRYRSECQYSFSLCAILVSPGTSYIKQPTWTSPEKLKILKMDWDATIIFQTPSTSKIYSAAKGSCRAKHIVLYICSTNYCFIARVDQNYLQLSSTASTFTFIVLSNFLEIMIIAWIRVCLVLIEIDFY